MLSCRSRKRHRWLYHFYRWQLQSSLRSTADAAPFWAPTRLSLCILQICPVPLQPSVNLLCIWRRAGSLPSYSALHFAHAASFPNCSALPLHMPFRSPVILHYTLRMPLHSSFRSSYCAAKFRNTKNSDNPAGNPRTFAWSHSSVESSSTRR